MKSIHYILIEPIGGRYNNSIKVGDNTLTVNTLINDKDYKFVNRIGMVKEVPRMYTGLKVGDKVVVHHNAFRRYWGFNGDLRDSTSRVDEDLFSCTIDQDFAYNRNGDWVTTEKWVFVAPVKEDGSGFSNETYKKNKGVVAIKNPNITSFDENDQVLFLPGGEYSFDVDGQHLYRMHKEDIVCVY